MSWLNWVSFFWNMPDPFTRNSGSWNNRKPPYNTKDNPYIKENPLIRPNDCITASSSSPYIRNFNFITGITPGINLPTAQAQRRVQEVQDVLWAAQHKHARDSIRIPPRAVFFWVEEGTSEAIRCRRAIAVVEALAYPTVVWYRYAHHETVTGYRYGPSWNEYVENLNDL